MFIPNLMIARLLKLKQKKKKKEPTEYVEEYQWTSERDKEKTDTVLLASTDDTKDFTYEKGIISYEASAMGTTTTVKLTKE